MRRARRAEAGLTEDVGRRWGGRKRPARRRSNGGGRLGVTGEAPRYPVALRAGGRGEAEPNGEKWGGECMTVALTSVRGRRRQRGQICGEGRCSDGGGSRKSNGEGCPWGALE
jgi:hypothetical protein